MKIRIQNFQSLADVEVEAEGLTVIVGRSDLGKSAFIRALEACLFNKPGESFVRVGAKTARVSIVDLPTNFGYGLPVEWEKGSGINRYKLDQELYDKVGRETPPQLIQWGYRDIEIKQGSSTTYIRPQVATQHEGPFLLNRSGSFISDVMTMASRLAVLLSASDRCVLDQKRNKTLLSTRKSDLESATKQLSEMKPVRDLANRVRELKPQFDVLSSQEKDLFDHRLLIARHKALIPTEQLSLPSQSEFPSDLGANVLEARRLIQQLRRLDQVPQIPAMQVDGTSTLQKYDLIIQTIGKLRELTQRLSLKLEPFIFQQQHSIAALDVEIEQTQAELEQLKETLKICPLCDRPFVEEHVHEVTH